MEEERGDIVGRSWLCRNCRQGGRAEILRSSIFTFPFGSFIAYRMQGRRMRMEMGIKNKFTLKNPLGRGNDSKVSL